MWNPFRVKNENFLPVFAWSPYLLPPPYQRRGGRGRPWSPHFFWSRTLPGIFSWKFTVGHSPRHPKHFWSLHFQNFVGGTDIQLIYWQEFIDYVKYCIMPSLVGMQPQLHSRNTILGPHMNLYCTFNFVNMSTGFCEIFNTTFFTEHLRTVDAFIPRFKKLILII